MEQKEVENMIKFRMEVMANKLNLVSREEFEVQKKIIEKLEKKLNKIKFKKIKKKITKVKKSYPLIHLFRHFKTISRRKIQSMVNRQFSCINTIIKF